MTELGTLEGTLLLPSPFDIDVVYPVVTVLLWVHEGGFPDNAAELIPAATVV